MNVKLPKSFLSLPPREKQIIEEMKTKEVEDQVNKHYAELQKIWLQMACIVLNRNFGFGKKRLLIFLGVWREIYRLNKKLENKETQTAYLTAEINRIFGEGGYPYQYIDKLEEME